MVKLVVDKQLGNLIKIWGYKMSQEEAKKELEKMGFTIEEQPKYKITLEEDEGFLMMYDDLEEFLKKCKD